MIDNPFDLSEDEPTRPMWMLEVDRLQEQRKTVAANIELFKAEIDDRRALVQRLEEQFGILTNEIMDVISDKMPPNTTSIHSDKFCYIRTLSQPKVTILDEKIATESLAEIPNALVHKTEFSKKAIAQYYESTGEMPEGIDITQHYQLTVKEKTDDTR